MMPKARVTAPSPSRPFLENAMNVTHGPILPITIPPTLATRAAIRFGKSLVVDTADAGPGGGGD